MCLKLRAPEAPVHSALVSPRLRKKQSHIGDDGDASARDGAQSAWDGSHGVVSKEAPKNGSEFVGEFASTYMYEEIIYTFSCAHGSRCHTARVSHKLTSKLTA